MKVKGWPSLHALASLCLWLLDDGVRIGLFQLWCRHQCTSLHSKSVSNPAEPYHWLPLASFQTTPCASWGWKLSNIQVELLMMMMLAFNRQCFEMITIAMTTMTIIDPHIIWREWPRKSGKKGSGSSCVAAKSFFVVGSFKGCLLGGEEGGSLWPRRGF